VQAEITIVIEFLFLIGAYEVPGESLCEQFKPGKDLEDGWSIFPV